MAMKSLRKICSMNMSDGVKNTVIRERSGLKEDLVTKEEKEMLR